MNQVTFEEVYANAYIRQSINVILRNTIRKYPMLENQIDDIQQDLLLSLNQNLEKFTPSKGSLEYFFRLVLDSQIRKTLRNLFSQKAIAERLNIHYSSAEAVIDLVSFENSSELLELHLDVKIILASLSEIEKEICLQLMDGYSMRSVAQRLRIPLNVLTRIYIPSIRKSFEEGGFGIKAKKMDFFQKN